MHASCWRIRTRSCSGYMMNCSSPRFIIIIIITGFPFFAFRVCCMRAWVLCVVCICVFVLSCGVLTLCTRCVCVCVVLRARNACNVVCTRTTNTWQITKWQLSFFVLLSPPPPLPPKKKISRPHQSPRLRRPYFESQLHPLFEKHWAMVFVFPLSFLCVCVCVCVLPSLLVVFFLYCLCV